jgi:WD40 repeat protein
VRLWDALRGDCQTVMQGHRDQVSCMSFHPAAGKAAILATGSHDATVRIWAVASGQERQLLKGHKGAVVGVAYNPDGDLLATASMDRTLRLWDAKAGGIRPSVAPPLRRRRHRARRARRCRC